MRDFDREEIVVSSIAAFVDIALFDVMIGSGLRIGDFIVTHDKVVSPGVASHNA